MLFIKENKVKKRRKMVSNKIAFINSTKKYRHFLYRASDSMEIYDLENQVQFLCRTIAFPCLFFVERESFVKCIYSMSLSVVLNWHVKSTRTTTKEWNPSEMFTYYLFVVFIFIPSFRIDMTEICVLEQVLLLLLAKVEIKYSCELSNFVIFDATERNETKYYFFRFEIVLLLHQFRLSRVRFFFLLRFLVFELQQISMEIFCDIVR